MGLHTTRPRSNCQTPLRPCPIGCRQLFPPAVWNTPQKSKANTLIHVGSRESKCARTRGALSALSSGQAPTGRAGAHADLIHRTREGRKGWTFDRRAGTLFLTVQVATIKLVTSARASVATNHGFSIFFAAAMRARTSDQVRGWAASTVSMTARCSLIRRASIPSVPPSSSLMTILPQRRSRSRA